MSVNIEHLLKLGRSKLAKANIDSYLLDARIILQYILNISHEQLILQFYSTVKPSIINEYLTLINRRANNEPVAYLIKQKEFYGLIFTVSNHTLLPRPDSETIVDEVLNIFKDHSQSLKILDLGTGSGCLLLTILNLYPNAVGTGIDCSREALEIARLNADLLKLNQRVDFKVGNWTTNINDKFDLVISNPPYINSSLIKNLAASVRDYEPHLALDGGTDGLDCYKLIIDQLTDLCKDNSRIIFEFGQDQETKINELLVKKNIQVINYRSDLNGIVRVLTAKLA